MIDLANGTCLRTDNAEKVMLCAVSGLKQNKNGLMICLYMAGIVNHTNIQKSTACAVLIYIEVVDFFTFLEKFHR